MVEVSSHENGALQVADTDPTDIPPGRFAVLSDPQGGHFSILQMRE